MTRDQMQLLHNLTLNGGRMPLALSRREEFADYEQNGWLRYQNGDLTPYMEMTEAGYSAISQARNSPEPQQ